MLLLAAAALAASSAPQAPPTTQRQARAMVRIVSGPPLRFAEIERRRTMPLRDSWVRGADGSRERVRLVEFE